MARNSVSYSSLYPRRSTLLNERETGLAAGLAPTPRLSQTPSQRKLLTEHRPGLTQSGRAGHLVVPQLSLPWRHFCPWAHNRLTPCGLSEKCGCGGFKPSLFNSLNFIFAIFKCRGGPWRRFVNCRGLHVTPDDDQTR